MMRRDGIWGKVDRDYNLPGLEGLGYSMAHVFWPWSRHPAKNRFVLLQFVSNYSAAPMAVPAHYTQTPTYDFLPRNHMRQWDHIFYYHYLSLLVLVMSRPTRNFRCERARLKGPHSPRFCNRKTACLNLLSNSGMQLCDCKGLCFRFEPASRTGRLSIVFCTCSENASPFILLGWVCCWYCLFLS